MPDINQAKIKISSEKLLFYVARKQKNGCKLNLKFISNCVWFANRIHVIVMSVNLYTQTSRGGVVDSNSESRIHLALIERQKNNVKYGTPHCLYSLATLSNGFYDVTVTSLPACFQIKRFRRFLCRTIEIKYH